MNGFISGPIGMPMQLMDEAAFAKMFPNAPPAAFQALQQGFRNRAKLGMQPIPEPPLRSRVKRATSSSPKGLPTMPAAVTSPPKRPAPVAAAPSAPRLSYTAPRNLNSSVRSIAGADAYTRVYAAQVAIVDLLSRERNNPNPAAAGHLSRNGFLPLNTAMTNRGRAEVI